MDPQNLPFLFENHFYKELEMLIKANPQELVKSERVIIACCESAFLDGLELLFSNGANIPEHFTHQKMLYKLLAKGNPIYVPIVKFMIRQGADCNYTHSETHRINNAHNHGWTADCSIGLIVPALDFDDEELIHLLIHNGAHIDSQIKVVDKNKTPFFSDNRQRVKILCLHPLYKALYNRKFDMANLLLASGSKREAWLDTEFNNAIFLESINQNMQNKDYFLGIKKADQMGFLKQDHYFSNMMRWAINQKNDVQWVKLLFEVGAQPKDSYLEWAIEKKNKEIIQLLIDNGAHP
jgi:ankyrin repeat protein